MSHNASPFMFHNPSFHNSSWGDYDSFSDFLVDKWTSAGPIGRLFIGAAAAICLGGVETVDYKATKDIYAPSMNETRLTEGFEKMHATNFNVKSAEWNNFLSGARGRLDYDGKDSDWGDGCITVSSRIKYPYHSTTLFFIWAMAQSSDSRHHSSGSSPNMTIILERDDLLSFCPDAAAPSVGKPSVYHLRHH